MPINRVWYPDHFAFLILTLVTCDSSSAAAWAPREPADEGFACCGGGEVGSGEVGSGEVGMTLSKNSWTLLSFGGEGLKPSRKSRMVGELAADADAFGMLGGRTNTKHTKFD